MVNWFVLAVATFVSWVVLSYWKPIKDHWINVYRCYYELANVPGPKNLPILGCTYQFKWKSTEFTKQLFGWLEYYCYECPERMGCMMAWVGTLPAVLICKPEYVKILLESNTQLVKPFPYRIVSEWIGDGLLTAENEKWQSRRKLLTPAFHFNVLKSYKDIMSKYGDRFTEHLAQFADTDREFDMYGPIKRCALDIICETAMGTELGTLEGGNSEYVDAVVRITDIVWSKSRFPWLWIKPIWYATGLGFEFNRLAAMTGDFTRKVIAQRRQVLQDEGAFDDNQNIEEMGRKKQVFLDLLLVKQKSDELSDEDIREEVDTFMFAGHDTTASAMVFTLWILGQVPEYQSKVHEEIDEVFGEDNRIATEADISRLVYLERCIKETLRLLPSVPIIGRQLSHDLVLGDTVIPENTFTVMSALATQRSPEYWERPKEYFPDHFLPEAVANRHPYAYFPFSAGARNCIGQKFAMSEMKMILSSFFRRYSIETIEPHPGNRPIPEVVLKPSNGLLCKINRRNFGDSLIPTNAGDVVRTIKISTQTN